MTGAFLWGVIVGVAIGVAFGFLATNAMINTYRRLLRSAHDREKKWEELLTASNTIADQNLATSRTWQSTAEKWEATAKLATEAAEEWAKTAQDYAARLNAGAADVR